MRSKGSHGEGPAGTEMVTGATAVGFALAGLTAVIATAARAPLSRATPIDARSARAPGTALFMLIVGAGIVGLAALVVIVWPGRRRPGDDDFERVPEQPQLHWIWKLLALVSPFALGAARIVAAVVGLRGASGTSASGSHAQAAPFVTSSRPPPTGDGFTVPAWLPSTVLGIVAIAIGVGVWLLSRWWRGPVGTASPPTPRCSRRSRPTASPDNPRRRRGSSYNGY
jgi:hypothetical protein